MDKFLQGVQIKTEPRHMHALQSYISVHNIYNSLHIRVRIRNYLLQISGMLHFEGTETLKNCIPNFL